jgi:hypothetical protein
MPIAKLGAVRMWYDERGQGDPLVLHPVQTFAPIRRAEPSSSG